MVNSVIIPIILGILFVGGAIAFCCKHFKKVKPSNGGSITTNVPSNNSDNLHVYNDKIEDVLDGKKKPILGDETFKELPPVDEIILVDGKIDDKVLLKDDLKIKKID